MSKFTAKLREEIRAIIPPAIYFFIALHLIALVRHLMLKGFGINAGTTLTVAVAALILAKAVLLADVLPFINLYPHKPLIYNIIWKTIIYTLIAMLIHYVERLVDFWRQAGGFIAGNEKMLSEMVWPHFWAVQIMVVVLILAYCTTRELVRIIGKDRMRAIFFGPVHGETTS